MASTFSYAQAAKGMSTTATPATQSKAPSGTTTPALTAEPTGINWADDGEAASHTLETAAEAAASMDEAVTNGIQKQAENAQQPGDSGISSPSVAASTTTKEDDTSSVPNASSESTWDNKSQASNAAEKSNDQGEAGPEKKQAKEKKEKKEKAPPKPLQEAPIPQVNIWKQRAEATAAKSTKTSTVAPAVKPVASAAKSSSQASLTKAGDSKVNAARKGKDDEIDSGKNKDEEQSGRRAQGDSSRARRGLQQNAGVPQPPVKDQESWPTPEDVQGEDRRKAQEKTEKSDKDRPVAATAAPKGKNEWVSLPYTPSVVFSTPMPNTGARRGGRGGGRGGAQVGGRPSSGIVNGAPSTEKDSASTAGEQSRRGRADGAVQDALPAKAKRNSSVGSAAGPMAETQKTEASSQAARLSNGDGPTGSISGSTNAQRSNAAPRHKVNRKFDQSGAERRKEDSVSPSDTTARRGSAAVQQSEDQGRRRSFSQSDSQPPPARSGGPERRSGQYGSGRERGENRGRGSMRGRNGNHGYQNGHHGNFPNGHASFSIPRSPPNFEPHTFFGQGPQQQQRGYRGGRAQSLQTDSMYGRPHPGYSNGQALPSLQTYMNGGVYDFPMQPMSALPYSPYMADPYHLLRTVQMQFEYYFSVDNLCKDMFMRKHMDSQGFVFLDFIAGFNRVKSLTTDISTIKHAITQSEVIDYKIGADGKDRLRRREGWDKWILTTAERDPSAQNDGPDELHQPPVSIAPPVDPRYMMQFPGSPVDMPTSPSHGGAFQPLNGIAQGASPANGGPAGSELVNGGHYTEGGTSQLSSMNVGAVPSFAPNPSPNGVNPEADSFSNDQTKDLTVVVRKHEQASEKQPAFHSEGSRTFSNGSIDSKSVAEELHKVDAKQTGPETNGHGPVEAIEGRQSDVLTRSQSPSSQSGSSAMRLFWVKDQQHPVQSESLPPDANVVLYTELYKSALKQREAVPIGNCPYDLVVLYQFWSHFLIRNFNTGMYNDFRRLAFEDIAHRSSDVGMRCLVKYYGEALSSQSGIRQRVARHYVDIVMTEAGHDDSAFTQLRTAWRDGSVSESNRQVISAFMGSELLASLEQ
ncbi:la domain-containing protein [Diplodia corticola]|uniref:La domain-containing protein n=1 Tax=Diplodia corticola TaxID=236234 RepID=A0A1J9RAU4_9PEZI|nr:la domain-containing protein [Diplodia corticola]OJD37593.1 la domain-containing protein [Diplodia corticola]